MPASSQEMEGFADHVDPARRRLNSIAPYFTMFPLAFPENALRGGHPNQTVLDPFCGRGTTLFAARLRGMNSIGIDVNPVAVALTRAKLATATADAVVHRCRRLLVGTAPTDPPEGEFWETAFHERTLADLARLRAGLLKARNTGSTVLLRAVVLGILHGPLKKTGIRYLSNQMPRTYATKPDSALGYWRDRNLQPPEIDLVDAVATRARFSLEDLPAPTSGVVFHGDAVTVLSRLHRRVDWIVCSPPYFGMRSYRPDQWLREWFLGGPPSVDYSDPHQVGRGGLDGFEAKLAAVWRGCARIASPGARLVVRFGSLPSSPTDPLDLLERSFRAAGDQWRILETVSAGVAPDGRRQAEQFGATGGGREEIDVTAELSRVRP